MTSMVEPSVGHDFSSSSARSLPLLLISFMRFYSTTVLLARVLGGRIGVAAAMAWGLSWIAVGRLTDQPASTLTGVAAVIAAVVVVAAAAMVWARRRGRAGAALA